MKKIKLTQGKSSLVDNSDYELLNKFKWQAYWDGYNWYAGRSDKKIKDKPRQTIKMHRVIMNPKKFQEVDHINGDGLNNQRKNLRLCSHQQNCFNRKRMISNTSGFKGVNWNKNSKKWIARIQINGKRISLGYFNSKEKANEIYIKNSKKYHGKYSKI